jgi:hypothetical protein
MRKTGPREAVDRAGTMPDKEYPLLVWLVFGKLAHFLSLHEVDFRAAHCS